LNERLVTLALQHSMTAEKVKEQEDLISRLPEAIKALVSEIHKHDLSLAYKLYTLGMASGVIQMSMAIHRIHVIIDSQVEAEPGSTAAKYARFLNIFFQNATGFTIRERWRASVQSAEIIETLNLPRKDENFVQLRTMWDEAIRVFERMKEKAGPDLFMNDEVKTMTALPEET
jgi:hypothetical protein